MRFRFSIKRLFVITTVISVLLGIAIRLKWLSYDWRFLAALGFYFLVYLFIVAIFYGPRYLREWKEFRSDLSQHQATRFRLEAEAQEVLASLKSESHADQQSGIDEASRS